MYEVSVSLRTETTTTITVTEISQERSNQDRTKIGPFFDFLDHILQYFYLKFLA